MIFVRSVPSVISALGFLVCVGCAANSVVRESERFANLGDYQHAFEVLDDERARQLEAGTVEDDLEEAYQLARLQYLRDRAQRRIFTEREDDALRDLDLVEKLAPGFPGVAGLRRTANEKKARRIVERADRHLAEGEFVDALEAYIESQRLVADYEPAKDGLNKVREETARLNERAQKQFLQAVRKVPEFRHIEVAWHAAAVLHLSPDTSDARSADAKELQQAARKESAQRVFERAKECEGDNQFGAARMLYLDARRLNPELPGVDAAIAQMDLELEALTKLEKAEFKMRNGQFDLADQLLKDAYDLSTFSRGAISELMIASRKRRAQERYQQALDLQVMGRKIEALAAFEALSKDWPDGFEDEQARVIGLKVDIDGAKTEWAAAEKAEAAGKLEEALDHYLAVEQFYAEWRDSKAQIERLRAAIAAKAAEEGGGSK